MLLFSRYSIGRVAVGEAALVGVESGVGERGGGVVPPEEQLARRVRQRDAAPEHLQVHHVRLALHAHITSLCITNAR